MNISILASWVTGVYADLNEASNDGTNADVSYVPLGIVVVAMIGVIVVGYFSALSGVRMAQKGKCARGTDAGESSEDGPLCADPNTSTNKKN